MVCFTSKSVKCVILSILIKLFVTCKVCYFKYFDKTVCNIVFWMSETSMQRVYRIKCKNDRTCANKL